jgi:hypothetical protein
LFNKSKMNKDEGKSLDQERYNFSDGIIKPYPRSLSLLPFCIPNELYKLDETERLRISCKAMLDLILTNIDKELIHGNAVYISYNVLLLYLIV